MHPTATALLEAHTRHMLNNLGGPGLGALFDEETAALCNWLNILPVSKVTDVVRVRDFLLRNVFEITPSETLLTQIGTLATVALTNPLNKTTALEELLNAREYDLIVDRVIALEELRHQIVHAVLQNPSVVQLISDLIYHGVKSYLVDENALTKKVPGMSSLMKMGKGMMERMGSLDAALENTLKSYIKRNTRATMDLAERLVQHAMETPKLKSVSREFWQQIKGEKLDRVTQYIKADDVDDVVRIGATLWNHFRTTPYARDTLNDLVHTWFERWGNQTVMQVLVDIGLTPERLQVEVRQFGEPLVAELIASGHLEARIRVHLETFYASPEATAALGG
ncbi:MAG: hypothetical protein KBD35_05855 [Moraxellaceae bacterium]|jgi:hypothetical protein|nr:hypothetical protein [Moraxellaceae bacterium]MBP9730910.1 hypothetical protein [Moraxellaceae bacterium]